MRDSREPKAVSGIARPRFLQSIRIKSNPSRAVVVGNSGILTSTRPGRLRSTSIRSGRLDASTPGSRFYGQTKQGKYMTEADAKRAAYRAAPKNSSLIFWFSIFRAGSLRHGRRVDRS